MTIRIALADDHELIRKSIAQMLEQMNLKVIVDAENGEELINQLHSKPVDVVLMDINMPVKNGIETTSWLRENMPDIKVIALTMLDDDVSVIRMLRSGARGYLIKNSRPADLVSAIHDVYEKGYHLSDLVSGRLIQNINSAGANDELHKTTSLSERENQFLRYCCSEMTYKEIGNAMHVSPRTAEGYSKSLCEKLGLKSRVGLVLYAIKNKIEVIQ